MIEDKKYTYEELLCLQEITELILKETNLDNALHQTLTILSDKLQLNRGIISIYQKELNEIYHDSFGFKNPQDKIKFAPGEGITGEVVKSGSPIAIPRLDKAPIFLDKTGIRKQLNRKELAFICVPVKYKNDTIGALSVDRKINENDSEDLTQEINFLLKIADLIAEIVNKKIINNENKHLKEILQKTNPLGTIVGNSKPMRELAYQISLISDKPIPVLIIGETGTGKELVAKQIHNMSNRRDNPFITVNCGAIPEGLIESELFGHKKGAFTGAIDNRIGKFEAANKGTLFLDEITELPLSLQVKLLRALQEREITPVGDNRVIKIDTKIISATNKNLEDEVKNNNFRADLYYRINAFQLYLPPLRERGADITLLADYFVKKYSGELGKKIDRIDTPAIDMLVNYHWPGNVRELENCIERACLLSIDGTIHAHHLPPTLQMKNIEISNKKRGKFDSLVKAYEIELITDTLKDTNGNQSKAAILLGTTKRVIQYKIEQYNIDYKRFKKNKE